jgi:hypothetical protein
MSAMGASHLQLPVFLFEPQVWQMPKQSGWHKGFIGWLVRQYWRAASVMSSIWCGSMVVEGSVSSGILRDCPEAMSTLG